jgi:hypothetical protein
MVLVMELVVALVLRVPLALLAPEAREAREVKLGLPVLLAPREMLVL